MHKSVEIAQVFASFKSRHCCECHESCIYASVCTLMNILTRITDVHAWCTPNPSRYTGLGPTVLLTAVDFLECVDEIIIQ